VWKLLEGPTAEPVTLARAKKHLKVDEDMTAEDELIEANITAAREYCEGIQNRAYLPQKWLYTIDGWPEFPIQLPRPPLVSVDHIKFLDDDEELVTWDSENYHVDTVSERGRIIKTGDLPSIDIFSYNSCQITYNAGITAPKRIEIAILLILSHWYNNREAVIVGGNVPREMELSVRSLLNMDRVWP